ncbi:unnamed protein product [Meloidogyne enterolobii]|uniref:Uncharacterized protein n=1 Tax=Meloidogyne enterolobii TaxID=390850 RepID=A0ACB1ABS3_MELEN
MIENVYLINVANIDGNNPRRSNKLIGNCELKINNNPTQFMEEKTLDQIMNERGKVKEIGHQSNEILNVATKLLQNSKDEILKSQEFTNEIYKKINLPESGLNKINEIDEYLKEVKNKNERLAKLQIKLLALINVITKE